MRVEAIHPSLRIDPEMSRLGTASFGGFLPKKRRLASCSRISVEAQSIEFAARGPHNASSHRGVVTHDVIAHPKRLTCSFCFQGALSGGFRIGVYSHFAAIDAVATHELTGVRSIKALTGRSTNGETRKRTNANAAIVIIHFRIRFFITRGD